MGWVYRQYDGEEILHAKGISTLLTSFPVNDAIDNPTVWAGYVLELNLDPAILIPLLEQALPQLPISYANKLIELAPELEGPIMALPQQLSACLAELMPPEILVNILEFTEERLTPTHIEWLVTQFYKKRHTEEDFQEKGEKGF